MDFRLVSPSDVAWTTATPRGAPRPVDKVVVQTPLAPCRVTLARPGMYRVDTAFRHSTVHHEFAEWVSALEESASENLDDWIAGREASSSVFRGSMRLMVFADTPVFDATGAMSADLMDAAACACLVELQGCWTTDDKWGLRWKVSQLKFDTAPFDTTPFDTMLVDAMLVDAMPFDTHTSDEPRPTGPRPSHLKRSFAFLDD